MPLTPVPYSAKAVADLMSKVNDRNLSARQRGQAFAGVIAMGDETAGLVAQTIKNNGGDYDFLQETARAIGPESRGDLGAAIEIAARFDPRHGSPADRSTAVDL